MNDRDMIDLLASDYAKERDELREVVQGVRDRLDRAQRQALPRLRALVRAVADARARLSNAIEAAPERWKGANGKRRTETLHGIKVGMRKGTGKLEWDDDQQLCELIRRVLPDQEAVLIRTSEAPNRTALADLPAADLRRLGVRIVDSGDQVVINPVDSAVDRLVDALMRDAERIEKSGQPDTAEV